MGRGEVPPDPTVLDQPGVSFTLGQASLPRYEGTEEQIDSTVRKSFPHLEVSEHFDLGAHLTGSRARKQHHGDACLPELLPARLEGSMTFKCSQTLHCSYLREQQHGWKTFMRLSARIL